MKVSREENVFHIRIENQYRKEKMHFRREFLGCGEEMTREG